MPIGRPKDAPDAERTHELARHQAPAKPAVLEPQPNGNDIKWISDVAASRNLTLGQALYEHWPALSSEQRLGILRKILRNPNKEQRVGEFLFIVRKLDREEIAAAGHMITEGDADGLNYGWEWENLVIQWGRVGGREAMEKGMAALGVQANYNPWFPRTSIEGWAEVDPKAAAAWLEAHQEHPTWTECLMNFAKGIANSDPNAAARVFAETMPDASGKMKKRMMTMLSEQVAWRTGIEGLRSWFDSVPTSDDGTYKRLAFEDVTWRLDRSKDGQLGDFLIKYAEEKWVSKDRYQSHFLSRCQGSLEDAISWAQQLPAQFEVEVGTVAREKWKEHLMKKPDAADWLAKQPETWLKKAIREN